VDRRNGFLFVLFLSWFGCGGSEPISQLNYGDAAQSLYSVALSDFYANNCIDAEGKFRDVRRKYPYSRFAALAELRLADCLFSDDKYIEAAQAYDQFSRRHPSHTEVSYARFKIAECHYEQIPSDWLLAPPAYERDQTPAQQSLDHLHRFISQYPKDPYTSRAKSMESRVLDLLSKHELYVAKFYLDRDQYRAAIGRLNTLVRSYSKCASEPEALFLLVESYLELGDRHRADSALRELIDRFPSSDYTEKARKRLNKVS
jgi:outer membrane protein assembly factor BamD